MTMINLFPKVIANLGMSWARSLSHSKTSSEIEVEDEPSRFTRDDAQYIIERVEQIRSEMRRCVWELPVADTRLVGRRIHFARNVQELWYLRSDLMALMSEATDEREAVIHIQRITRMFQGLMPDSLFGPRTYMH